MRGRVLGRVEPPLQPACRPLPTRPATHPSSVRPCTSALEVSPSLLASSRRHTPPENRGRNHPKCTPAAKRQETCRQCTTRTHAHRDPSDRGTVLCHSFPIWCLAVHKSGNGIAFGPPPQSRLGSCCPYSPSRLKKVGARQARQGRWAQGHVARIGSDGKGGNGVKAGDWCEKG